MSEQLILTSLQDRIFEITLNRPEQYNALSNELMEQLNAALDAFAANEDASVCIIKGAGKNFSSGADIKQFGSAAAQTDEMIEHRADLTSGIHHKLASIPKPFIASVRGYALAGGCGIALATDFVIASANAVFGYPEVRRGIVPAVVMANLSKLVGKRRALDMILTGRKIPAAEAMEYDMITAVVPDDKLEARTAELAQELAKQNLSTLIIKSTGYLSESSV